MAGNNDVRDDLIIEATELHLTDLHLTVAPAYTPVGAVSQQTQRCLRDNESSQQQLVRLVGHRSPTASTAASWDRLRREQAALQGAS